MVDSKLNNAVMSVSVAFMTKLLKRIQRKNILRRTKDFVCERDAYMAIIRCSHGHHYENKKFKECPYCLSVERAEISNEGDSTIGSSIGLFESTIDRKPVAGWLVCTAGPEKGRDYRITAGKNSVGRSWKMDISIAKDPEAMHADHACVTYDTQENSFWIIPKEEAETLLNGKRISEAALLKENDRIRFGGSEFVFVSYCNADRGW